MMYHQLASMTIAPALVHDNGATQHYLFQAWEHVGCQIQQLGVRLARAVSQNLNSDADPTESTELLQELRDQFREAANQIDQLMFEDQSRQPDHPETLRPTRSDREQALEEVRLLTVATLRKLNRQLDHLNSSDT